MSRFIRASLAALLLCVPWIGHAVTDPSDDSATTLYTNDGTDESGVDLDDNSVVIQTGSIERYNAFCLTSTAGAMDVFLSVDGTNYSTAATSLVDQGASDTNPVVVTVANRVYCFRGLFKKIRVLQNGATDADGASLRAGVI